MHKSFGWIWSWVVLAILLCTACRDSSTQGSGAAFESDVLEQTTIGPAVDAGAAAMPSATDDAQRLIVEDHLVSVRRGSLGAIARRGEQCEQPERAYAKPSAPHAPPRLRAANISSGSRYPMMLRYSEHVGRLNIARNVSHALLLENQAVARINEDWYGSQNSSVDFVRLADVDHAELSLGELDLAQLLRGSSGCASYASVAQRSLSSRYTDSRKPRSSGSWLASRSTENFGS